MQRSLMVLHTTPLPGNIMKRILLIVALFLSAPNVRAQLLRSATLEVVGSPGWYKAIPLKQEGVVMIVKEDQTRFKVVKLDAQLNKIWDQDLFLDTEKGPAAVALHNGRLTLMFSETSGMYYQLLDFDLKNGEYVRRGFEIREFFQDKGLIMYEGKALLTGINEKGLAYFVYDFNLDTGKLVQTGLAGKIEIQDAQKEEDGSLNMLVVEKTMGYANESKKKGEYVKSSQVAEVRLDTAGQVLDRKNIVQNGGRFPISGVRSGNWVSGIYQQPDGQKGMYFSLLSEEKNIPVFYRSFSVLAGDHIEGKQKDKFLKNASWLVLPPKQGPDQVHIGGVFYTPRLQNVSSGRGYDAYGNRTRAESRTVFAGLEFASAKVFALDSEGKVLSENSIVLNQLLGQLTAPLSINRSGAVAYVSNGKVLVKNFNIGSRPIAYQLTEDKGEGSPYVAGYRQTLHWYDNVFLAIGTQSRMEAQQVSPATGKKKKKRSIPYTQTRKTYFLTSISAGKSE